MKLQFFSGFPAVSIEGLVGLLPALVMVWRPHSTQCSNVNSGLNINQESTHTARSCLDLTLPTPVEGKQTRPRQGFFILNIQGCDFYQTCECHHVLFSHHTLHIPRQKGADGSRHRASTNTKTSSHRWVVSQLSSGNLSIISHRNYRQLMMPYTL